MLKPPVRIAAAGGLLSDWCAPERSETGQAATDLLGAASRTP